MRRNLPREFELRNAAIDTVALVGDVANVGGAISFKGGDGTNAARADAAGVKCGMKLPIKVVLIYEKGWKLVAKK